MASLREQHQAQTRELLLDTASELFARRGYRATTLNEIAEASGATTGAVYANFANKEDLFIAVLERHMERQVRFYTTSFDTEGDLPSRARSGADTWVERVALVIYALGNGLALQKAVDPGNVPDELFGDALEAGTSILAQLSRPPAD